MKRLLLLLIVLIGCETEQPVTGDSTAIKDAVIADKISKEDLNTWYSLYRGTYIYSHDLDLEGCSNYEDIFVKFRFVRGKLNPAKGNTNLSVAVDKLLEEFKTAEFSEENHEKLNDALAIIYTGIKEAM